MKELVRRNWLDRDVSIIIQIIHHAIKTANVAEVQVKFQKVEHPVTSILVVTFDEKHVFHAQENVYFNEPHEKTEHVFVFF